MEQRNSGTITTQNVAPTADSGTNGSTVTLRSIEDAATLVIQTIGTYTGALSLQARLRDSGVWVTLAGTPLLNVGAGTYSGNIGSGVQGLFQADVSAFDDVRVTALAAVTGSVQVVLKTTDAPAMIALDAGLPAGSNTIGTVTAIGSTATSLGKAEDAVHASGDTGVPIMGVRAPATPATPTSAAGDYGMVMVDTEGKIIAAQYADSAQIWQANPVTLTTTTSTALKAAGAAGIRNYLTDIDIANTSATATRIDLLDGATVIASFQVPAGSHIQHSYSVPKKGTAATALNVQSSVAVTDVRVSANGYLGV